MENLELAKYRQEWWKVGVSALTPIAIAILTFFISDSLNQQQSQLRIIEQTISEKEKMYADIGKKINIIYVYVRDIGDFRAFEPGEIIELRQESDRTFYTYKPYWSKETIASYDEFMSAAFRMYSGSGNDAQIRSGFDEKRLMPKNGKFQWDKQWDHFFTNEGDVYIDMKYDNLIQSFLKDIASGRIGV